MKSFFIFALTAFSTFIAAEAQAQTSAKLKGLLDTLPKTASPEQAKQITEAINASPELSAQLGALVSSGKLTQIKVVPVRNWGKPFNAVVDGATMVFAKDFLNSQSSKRLFDVVHDDDILPNNLVFCIGHLAYHLKFGEISMSGPDLKSFLRKMGEQEASAYIQGWNDVVDAAVISNGGKALSPRQGGQLLMNMRYRAVFLKALGQAEKLELLSSGKIKSNQKNISSMTSAILTSQIADIE